VFSPQDFSINPLQNTEKCLSSGNGECMQETGLNLDEGDVKMMTPKAAKGIAFYFESTL
jgi:hypothetical protein